MSCKTGFHLFYAIVLASGVVTTQNALADPVPTSMQLYFSMENYSEDANFEVENEPLHHFYSVKAAKNLDWCKVNMSIAMTRTSLPPYCLYNCAGAQWRGSKVRLMFPPEFLQHVEKKLGGKVGKAYFLVHINRKPEVGDQKIFFDINLHKKTADGRYYFERSSSAGEVEGPRCATRYPGAFAVFLSVSLKSVHFENADGSQTVNLLPQKEPESRSTGKHDIYCRGSFVTQRVIPWND